MNYSCLIFDLDGTISDPKGGFVRSLNYSLAEHGFASRDEGMLSAFIGPPLDRTFKTLTESDQPDLIESLVAKYRERYSDVGFSENVVYAGIPEALERLSSVPGLQLGMCTSKRADFAERKNRLHSAGVLWGFGSLAELTEHEPEYLFSRPAELLELTDAPIPPIPDPSTIL